METWLSVLEHHSSKQNKPSQDHLHHKVMVAINGPVLIHWDNMVKEALNMFYYKFKREGNKHEWNFVGRSNNIKSHSF